MTATESAVFDYALRLADMHKELADSGVRQDDSRPALRFADDRGNEVRGPRHDESIRGAVPFSPLSDGIRPDEFSIGRLVRAAVRGEWRNAEAERRAMGGSVDSLGGYLVLAQIAADIIDLARDQTVALQAGGVTLPMLSDSLTIAKLTKDATAGWKVENIPAALDQTPSERSLSTRKRSWR